MHILLIDDDSTMLETLSLAMRSVGHTVVMVRDGEEGLACFRSQPFDIVVTDILMPGKDGLQVIDEIRSAVPDTKVLAISGGSISVVEDRLEVARSKGAMATLTKPFPLSELHAALDWCAQ